MQDSDMCENNVFENINYDNCSNSDCLDIYAPKNILITGGAGFIASHVILMLVSKYPEITIVNLDRLDYCACKDNLETVETCKNYKFIKGDICSSDLINYVLKTENIDTIMHFAAQTHVDNSFGNSFKFTQTNILGTHILLESAKKHGIARFIHVSTDEVYGEQMPEQKAMLEEQVLEPTNPYAATKAGAEFIAKSYHRSFSMPIIITRGNNVYGPHQYPEKMIPKFINQLMLNKKITIHGTGNNTRNFLFVEDVARAFEIILFKGKIGSIYNIGGHNEIKNIDVAKKIITSMGKKPEDVIEYVDDRVFNDLRYHINTDRLCALGWKEQVSWKDGLSKTIEWYRQHSQKRYGDVSHLLVGHPSQV